MGVCVFVCVISWTIIKQSCTSLQTVNHTNTTSLIIYRSCVLNVIRLRVWRSSWMVPFVTDVNWNQLYQHLPMKLTARYFPVFSSNDLLLFIPSVLWRCWLGGRKGIWPVKIWVVGCWHGYLSGARCTLAYGPADATATHCLLLQ